MKRFILVVSVVVFAACGNGENNGTNNGENNGGNNGSNNGGNNGSNNGSNNGVNNGSNNGSNNGGGVVIDPTSYDQVCQDDEGCELIFAGPVCECKLCADAAISVLDLDAYDLDVQTAECNNLVCTAEACGDNVVPRCIFEAGAAEGTCTAVVE